MNPVRKIFDILENLRDGKEISNCSKSSVFFQNYRC
jgi:hypothetical protein